MVMPKEKCPLPLLIRPEWRPPMSGDALPAAGPLDAAPRNSKEGKPREMARSRASWLVKVLQDPSGIRESARYLFNDLSLRA